MLVVPVQNECTLVLRLAEVEVTEVKKVPFESRKRSESLPRDKSVVLNCLLIGLGTTVVLILKLNELIC